MQTVIGGLEEQLKPAMAKQQQDLDQVSSTYGNAAFFFMHVVTAKR